MGIGALCTIDKGVTGDTTIGAGTKIDNQVHVGPRYCNWKKCLIASQTGIAGCVVIEMKLPFGDKLELQAELLLVQSCCYGTNRSYQIN